MKLRNDLHSLRDEIHTLKKSRIKFRNAAMPQLGERYVSVQYFAVSKSLKNQLLKFFYAIV